MNAATKAHKDMAKRLAAKRSASAKEAYDKAKIEIADLLRRVELGISDMHTGERDLNWGHVGDLNHVAEQLRELGDQLWHEGEYAE